MKGKYSRYIDFLVRKFGIRTVKLRSIQVWASLQDAVIGSVFEHSTDSRILDDLTEAYIYLQMLKVIYDITDEEFDMLVRYKIEKKVEALK